MIKKHLGFLIYILIFIGVIGVGVCIDLCLLGGTSEEEAEAVTDFSIRIAKKQQSALIENENGEEEVVENIVTIDEVDGEKSMDECPEGEECGKGKFIYAPTNTFTAFKDYTLNKCWDLDERFGAQCWDLAAVFWENYTKDGRTLSTCGTGAAKGAWDCKEQNAGDDFILITDPKYLQAGDWVIFSSGRYGHVGMALGSYNNGYVTLLGQNQGGKSCKGGGSATNIINISLKSFSGAFRPVTYIKVDPKPEPTPEDKDECSTIKVKAGDTLGNIMQRCEGEIKWGEAMNEYAKSWTSSSYKFYDTVYDGWVSEGRYGLFAGDTITRKE